MFVLFPICPHFPLAVKTRWGISAEMWLVLSKHLLIAVLFEAQFIFEVGSASAEKMQFDKAFRD